MTEAGPRSPWIRRLTARARPRARLVCLPSAGAAPAGYSIWRGWLPDDVELGVLCLPGRESRLGEPPVDVGEEVVDELAAALPDDLPVAVYGHSLGAALGFDLVRRLESVGAPPVVGLVVAAAPAPGCPPALPHVADLPRLELIDRLIVLGGIPDELAAAEDLLDLLLPAVRADLRIAEAWWPKNVEPVGCPITAIAGRDDPIVDPASTEAWADCTTSSCRRITVPGNHFLTGCGNRVFAEVLSVLDRTGTESDTSR